MSKDQRNASNTYTSGVDCVVNATELFGGIDDSILDRLLVTDINFDDSDSKVWVLRKSLSLSSRLLSPLEVNVSHDQAAGAVFVKG